MIVIFSLLGTWTAFGRQAPAKDLPPSPPDAQSTSGPAPSFEISQQTAYSPSASAVTISGVPAYYWQHGCGPTAAGMLIGYYDGQGYPSLVPGSAQTQTAAVDEMIASEGPASHYSDYSQPIDSYPTLKTDKSAYPIGDEHPDECLADFMKTSQSYYSNYYGWSYFSYIAPALKSYVENISPSGFQVTTRNLYLYVDYDPRLTWELFQAEIDAGRPLVFLVDTNGDGKTDHFVPALGYDTSGGKNYYACYNTWDSNIHWYEFAVMSSGRSWGIWGAVTFSISTNYLYDVFLPLILQSFP